MNEIETEVVPETQPTALVTRPQGQAVAPPAPDGKAQITPAQAKVDAVASLTMQAYQRAATLALTAEESKLLQADFPDEAFQPGAAGKEHLIYIEHAHLRDRFTQVFGMGQWAIIPRSRWNESFRTGKGTEGERIYVEAMLVVRGCFVGEAVGAMEYYPKNESQNYGDAVEGAKTAAFRRCAKEFGVGLQAWKKDWCESWWQRRREKMRLGNSLPKRETKVESKSTLPKPEPPQCATDKTRAWMIVQVNASPDGPARGIVTEYFRKCGQILPNEEIEDLPLRFVPMDKKELSALVQSIGAFEAGQQAMPAFEPHNEGAPAKKTVEVPRENPDKPGDLEEWRTFPMPFGQNAGVALEELEKKYLYGLWANFTVEEEYNGRPKKPETIAKDRKFREMLDAAGDHYEFTKKD